MESSEGRVDSSHNMTPTRTFTVGTQPSRGGLSAERPSSHRSAFHAPLGRKIDSTQHSVWSDASAHPGRRDSAPAPHTTASPKVLNRRRNDLPPLGKTVPHGLMRDRETPMDILSRLAGAVAPGSKPFVSSSPVQHGRSSFARIPRRSIDEKSDLVPSPSSTPEENNLASQFPKLPQGALSEQPYRVSGSSSEGGSDSRALGPDGLVGDIAEQSDLFSDVFLKDIQEQTNASADRTCDGYDTMCSFSFLTQAAHTNIMQD